MSNLICLISTNHVFLVANNMFRVVSLIVKDLFNILVLFMKDLFSGLLLIIKVLSNAGLKKISIRRSWEHFVSQVCVTGFSVSRFLIVAIQCANLPAV